MFDDGQPAYAELGRPVVPGADGAKRGRYLFDRRRGGRRLDLGAGAPFQGGVFDARRPRHIAAGFRVATDDPAAPAVAIESASVDLDLQGSIVRSGLRFVAVRLAWRSADARFFAGCERLPGPHETSF